jgi:uncharacterized protein (TIGR03790 family)
VRAFRLIGLAPLLAAAASALDPSQIVLVVNDNSPLSRSVAEYYARRRGVPSNQICRLRTTEDEEVSRSLFDKEIAAPLAAFLNTAGRRDRILGLVTTAGVPLKIKGTPGRYGDQAAVDSELALLYWDLSKNQRHSLPGSLPNPFYKAKEPFSHPRFPMYLVARLAAYSFPDIKAMIDRSLEARDRGIAVFDTKGELDNTGDTWLIAAAARLPRDRVLLDDTPTVIAGARDVIAYAGWGSNDKHRQNRDPKFAFLPGAVVTEFVSTNARSLRDPGPAWNIGLWSNPASFFAGSPQSLAADYLRFGATAVTGHVYEPYLSFCPRPEILLPAYILDHGSLAESFYRSIPALSWQNVLVGDPLTQLRP